MTNRIILSGILWITALVAAAQVSYLDRITVETKAVRKVDDNVTVDLLWQFAGLKVNTQNQAKFTPVLVAADGTAEAELPPVFVEGRVRRWVNERRELSADWLPRNGEVVRRHKGKYMPLEYHAEIPWERWMYGARIEIREYVTGCANCLNGYAATTVVPSVLPYRIPDASAFRFASLVTPEEEDVKMRSITFRGRFQFRLDKYDIDPAYKDNYKKLEEAREKIDEVASNPDLSIVSIEVAGYTSPEATVAYNERLARNRSTSLVNYMKKRFPQVPAQKWFASWPNEDWGGLREAVEKDTLLPGREQILDVIGKYPDNLDLREQKLKELRPATIYETLYRKHYPYLRHNDYIIRFAVRSFTVEEARAQLLKQPEHLSAAEIYRVAMSYPENSPERIEAFQTAVRLYPSDDKALQNLAVAYLQAGDPLKALALLDGKAHTASLQNIVGVAFIHAKRYEEARLWFEKTAGAGASDARANLQLLNEWLSHTR